jgi:hypothetical protein
MKNRKPNSSRIFSINSSFDFKRLISMASDRPGPPQRDAGEKYPGTAKD